MSYTFYIGYSVACTRSPCFARSSLQSTPEIKDEFDEDSACTKRSLISQIGEMACTPDQLKDPAFNCEGKRIPQMATESAGRA